MPSHAVGRNNLFAAGLLESFTQTWSNRCSMSRQRRKLRLSLGEVMRFCEKAKINVWIHINIHTCTHGAICWDRKQMCSISIFQNASNNTTTCKALGSIYICAFLLNRTLTLTLSLSLREFAALFLITIIKYETGIACSFVQMWIASSQMRSDKTRFIIESIWSHSAKGSFIYWGSHVDSLILKTIISQRELKGSTASDVMETY